jgi:hypothetical protein
MNAWGYRPFDNDDASEWVLRRLEVPLAREIAKALRRVLEKKCRTPKFYNEAIAAAALLDALSPYDCGREAWICLRFIAEDEGLYSLAFRVLKLIANDARWLATWEIQSQKRKEIAVLIATLKRKARQEITQRRK